MHDTTGDDLFSTEEKWLFYALSRVLQDREEDSGTWKQLPAPDWNRFLELARCHAVLPLLYSMSETDEIPGVVRQSIASESRRTVQQSYRLMFLTHYIVDKLEREGIRAAVLKGVAAAGCYPVPELRKSGDVDLLLADVEKCSEAERIMAAEGFRKNGGQHAGHHQVWRTEEGIDIELHIALAEDFDNRMINDILCRQLDVMAGRVRRETVMGLRFPVLADGDHAYFLLLHMLHHFLRAGFGIKLLCDWVVFWNGCHSETEIRRYLDQIAETGLEGFSDMVTCLCVRYLGLSEECADRICRRTFSSRECQEFMRDILDGGEFGMREGERMVVVRGRGPAGYMREFHHQMRLNFPEKSKIPAFWPALWIATAARFLRNNRKHRGISTFRVLKKAGERGKTLQSLELFRVRRRLLQSGEKKEDIY